MGTGETIYRITDGTPAHDRTSLVDTAGSRLTLTTGTTTRFTLFDHLGSLVGLVNPSGSLAEVYRFDGYGQALPGTTQASKDAAARNPFRFRGAVNLATDAEPLYEMGARLYAPSAGAWTSLDTYAGSAQDPASMNRFVYTASNPTSLIDPDGHTFCSVEYDGCSMAAYNPQKQGKKYTPPKKPTQREAYTRVAVAAAIATGRGDRREPHRPAPTFWGYTGAMRDVARQAMAAIGYFREFYDEEAGASTLPQNAVDANPEDAPRLAAITTAIDALTIVGDYERADYLFQERQRLVPGGYAMAVGGTAGQDTLLQMGQFIGVVGGDSLSGPSLTTTGQGTRWAQGSGARPATQAGDAPASLGVRPGEAVEPGHGGGTSARSAMPETTADAVAGVQSAASAAAGRGWFHHFDGLSDAQKGGSVGHQIFNVGLSIQKETTRSLRAMFGPSNITPSINSGPDFRIQTVRDGWVSIELTTPPWQAAKAEKYGLPMEQVVTYRFPPPSRR